jgi:hypothetical protein
MKWRIKELIKSLTLIGYGPFEIKSIVTDAIGNEDVNDINIVEESLIVRHLERYEQLGSLFLQTCSK